jgi:hypothetical protein
MRALLLSFFPFVQEENLSLAFLFCSLIYSYSVDCILYLSLLPLLLSSSGDWMQLCDVPRCAWSV